MTGEYELTQAFKSGAFRGSGFINWTVLPEFPTLEWYRRLLFILPSFLSCSGILSKWCSSSWRARWVIAVPAAWAFTVYRFPFPQAFVYPVYCFNADTISGDHAVLISGAGPAASYGYAGCRHTSCHFSTFPCVPDLQRVLSIHPGCWRPEG